MDEQIYKKMKRMQDYYKNSLQDEMKRTQLLMKDNIYSEIASMQDYLGNPLQDEMLRIQEYLGNSLHSGIYEMHEYLRSPVRDEMNQAQFLMKDTIHSEIARMKNYLGTPLQDKMLQMQEYIGDTIHSEISRLQDLWNNPLQKHIDRFQEIAKSALWDEINALKEASESNIFRSISSFIPNLADTGIVINDGMTISYSNQIFEIDRIKYLVENAIDSATEVFDETKSYDEYFKELISEINKIKDTALQTLIKTFLLPILSVFIITFFTPQIQNISIRVFPIENKKQVIKKIEKNVSQLIEAGNFEKEILKKYRIVTAKTLNVRFKNRNNSRIVGQLQFGNIVKVVEKNKKWILIEWKDSHDEIAIKGWVFCKYLKKLK